MKNIVQKLAVCAVGSFLIVSTVYAADMGSVSISSPKNGSTVMAGTMVKLIYNVKLGPEGNHLHVYVDDEKPIVVRNVTNCPCSIELPALTAGKHTIVIDQARADHSLTGVKTSIMITAK
jgi:hypothetical protein